MPAAKTLRGQNRKAARNRSTRTFTRSRVRAVVEAIADGSTTDESDTSLRDAISALDRAVSKGALRHTSKSGLRLSRDLNSF